MISPKPSLTDLSFSLAVPVSALLSGSHVVGPQQLQPGEAPVVTLLAISEGRSLSIQSDSTGDLRALASRLDAMADALEAEHDQYPSCDLCESKIWGDWESNDGDGQFCGDECVSEYLRELGQARYEAHLYARAVGR